MQIIGQIGAFEAPFGGLGATYDVHLRLIGSVVGDFLLVIIELFSLDAFVLSQSTRLTDRRTDRQNLDSNTVRMLRSRTLKILGYMLILLYSHVNRRLHTVNRPDGQDEQQRVQHQGSKATFVDTANQWLSGHTSLPT